MKINIGHESPLKLKRLLISECNFKRSEDTLKNLILDVNISRNIEVFEADTYKITLDFFMSDDKRKIEVSIKCIAYFETQEENIQLIEKNTIAIMFPYVRSYVSIITTQPGMSPIVLPPINVAAMFQEQNS